MADVSAALQARLSSLVNASFVLYNTSSNVTANVLLLGAFFASAGIDPSSVPFLFSVAVGTASAATADVGTGAVSAASTHSDSNSAHYSRLLRVL